MLGSGQDVPTAVGEAFGQLAAPDTASLQANSDIDSENSVVTQAYAIANAMATGACAGMGPGSPPPPMPHIS